MKKVIPYREDKYIKRKLWDNFIVSVEDGFTIVYFKFPYRIDGSTQTYYLIQCPRNTFRKNRFGIVEWIKQEKHYKKYLWLI